VLTSDCFLSLVRKLRQRLLKILRRAVGASGVCEVQNHSIKLYERDCLFGDYVFVLILEDVSSPRTSYRASDSTFSELSRLTKMKNDRNQLRFLWADAKHRLNRCKNGHSILQL